MAKRDVGGMETPGMSGEETRFYGGSPGAETSGGGHKKKPRRPRDRDATGIGCVLPKAGKRRDGARGSGANVPGPFSLSPVSPSPLLPVPVNSGRLPIPGKTRPENWSATSVPGDRANQRQHFAAAPRRRPRSRRLRRSQLSETSTVALSKDLRSLRTGIN